MKKKRNSILSPNMSNLPPSLAAYLVILFFVYENIE